MVRRLLSFWEGNFWGAILNFAGVLVFVYFSGSYHPINNDFRCWSHLISYPKVRSSGIEAEQKVGCGEGKFMEVCSLNFDLILGKTISFWQKRWYARIQYEFGLKQILERFPPCMSWKSRQATLKVISDQLRSWQIVRNRFYLSQSHIQSQSQSIISKCFNFPVVLIFCHGKISPHSCHRPPPATATRCLLWAPVGMNHSSQSWGVRAGWNRRQQDRVKRFGFLLVLYLFLGEKEHCGGFLLCVFFVFSHLGNHIQVPGVANSKVVLTSLVCFLFWPSFCFFVDWFCFFLLCLFKCLVFWLVFSVASFCDLLLRPNMLVSRPCLVLLIITLRVGVI